jgi:hypothetical protein
MPLNLKSVANGSVILNPASTVTDKTITVPATDGTMVVQDGTNTTTLTNLAYTGTLTGGTGVVNIGSGQVYKDASGNVGIGTAAATYNYQVKNLVIADGTNAGVSLTNTSQILTLTAGYGACFVGAKSNHPLIFTTNDVERARIDASGNVGIGTVSTAYKLEVNGSISGGPYRFTSASAGAPGLVRTDSSFYNLSSDGTTFGYGISTNNAGGFDIMANQDGQPIRFYCGTSNASPTLRMTLTGGGSLTVPQVHNDTTASAANVNIQGDGFFRRSTSALKYKQDIRDLENIDINLFRPVRYKSKCDADDQSKDHIGIIADEVAAAGIEELVNRGAEGDVEGFQYERLTVVLLKAIQEQQAMFTELKAEFDAYKLSHP